jgi:thiamine-phosphate pyrophosphorylase
LRDFLPKLEAAFGAADIACVLIAAPEGYGDEALSAIADPLIQAVQRRDAAALLDGRPELAKRLNADGAHLDLRLRDTDDALRVYRHARKTLGTDAVVGVLCAAERHAAMEIAEAEADYIGFDLAAPETEDVIAWWGEVMTVPCIAFGSFDAAQAGKLASVGADFLAPDCAFWNATAPTKTLAALSGAIG